MELLLLLPLNWKGDVDAVVEVAVHHGDFEPEDEVDGVLGARHGVGDESDVLEG